MKVTVIGAGLAGSEAAWQIARQGVPVRLYEMRPVQKTPAHHTDQFAELVCTNSLRAAAITNAVGLLKEEMRRFDSIIMKAADEHAVPAGGALAVDREAFSDAVTAALESHPLVEVVREEVPEIPADGIVVVATGPLTSERLSASIRSFIGSASLYFFDAAAPIVTKESVDMDKVYLASRYNKGEAAYLNCPMTEDEFAAFYEALVSAETAPLHDFEEERYFEGCMPIEVMAKRGAKTLLFGPMKPVGLEDPRTGRRPYAVVQLRQDNAAATLFNMVGFQTHLKWGEQGRVFRMIPGLEHAEFVRYGVMHRNTYINSPTALLPTYQTRARDTLFFAGQITGVEGYVESAAAGLVAGLNAGRLALDRPLLTFPQTTAIGSLAHYITHTDPDHFQPMNATFGLIPPLSRRIRDKRERALAVAERALQDLEALVEKVTV
ncbi:methylenetetrahydrofolate--tRNA-(uracil(54)-C(5))-methyltransferase (FADH(2)-oxidizing) TrmFO [Alicyclobacillus cycloheptanicus]|uniref:Methylenetetrahydrofolate--tRNA-(uracil-5-)-methyltransferase TrmFO n=1 Tax=Alicyclobacillus cycloheptanicus TaxID=1457 RepID=A0ABT9XJT6_9BACL|nr:methylenetetrahydrofolate--tRNA-(uracil(54)-C(5))-methyltransferase (FADH(2)-oxidizing) TrmFO [Alicyclobacillus cycloheptanicus]MDQ0190568.1 methylenetetrahydrofolate--tRNA-(uracil-5-)-methyltransferase [Alicyclobacillus cycloheptanicus]WDM01408.1 methylenetetrahydrofolate--tRNA-(uracil(54)-C(5))-methyltransferase (FADH(2)-oxidizing) TrmFO [Alicyclobacillus cycloheptanicus]